jgi:TonB family protein
MHGHLGAEYAAPLARREGLAMTMPNYQPQVNLTAVEPAAREKLRFGMLVALAVLGACALVFAYYRWFGNAQTGASNEVGVNTPETAAEKPRHVRLAKSQQSSSKNRTDAVVSPAPDAQLTLAPGITQSAIRSPLAVEVISSDGQHQMIGTRNDSIYLGLHDSTPVYPDVADANAGNGKTVVDPVLAKQQTMEGSVVLLARIDKDGNIQSLQPISGPEILFTAAREAVKQWRFKPYYTSGQAIESETAITVKFAISAH